LARLYLHSWSIEGLFNVLTTTLSCEQTSLGYPKAALFSFCVTLVAYNVLATVEQMYGLPKTGLAANAPAITDIWA